MVSRADKSIFLLNPHNILEDYHYAVPQVALGYLASALRKHGYRNVVLKDALLYQWTFEEVIKQIKEVNPDVLCIRVWSHQVNVVKSYINEVRNYNKDMKIILGGPHITTCPQDLGSFKGADFAISGEAEEGLPLLLDYTFYSLGKIEEIPGYIYQSEVGFKMNPMSQKEDLDQFHVDWSDLEIQKYHLLDQRTTAYDYRNSKNAFIFASRGCPYPCTYCAAYLTNGKKIRYHSPARMMEDMKYLYSKFGVRHFNIMDDNFTFHKDYVMKFCHEFLKYKDNELKGVTFNNPNGVRVDRLDNEMLALMKKCGWQWLHIGIESANKNTLRKMKKNLRIEKAKENINLISENGLKCWGFFILGFVDETRDEMEETINFAIQSKLSAATFSLFSPIPGTHVYQDLLQQKRIPINYNMTGYNSGSNIVFAKGMTENALKEMQRKALVRFYSRPDRAFHLLRDMSFATFYNRVKNIFFSYKQSA